MLIFKGPMGSEAKEVFPSTTSCKIEYVDDKKHG